ncbi:chaplin family protein [Actinocatenispora rupis]|nr:chaplin family protein [Actinocatenispora rupis]
MKTWVRRTARVGILSAGFLLAGASIAHAGPNAVSAGNSGIGNGTQVVAPVQVPVNVAGNGVGVAGVGLGVNGSSTAVAHRAESARTTEGANLVSADNKGIANGTQAYAPIQVPANVAGNGVGVAGVGIGVNGSSTSVAHRAESARTTEGANLVSADNKGIANGTQAYLPIQVPVNVCGNGVGVLGAGIGVSGSCTSVAAAQESAHTTEGANLASAGNAGILNGTQVYAPIQVPVNVCGNGVGVLGVGAGVSGACDSVAARQESARTTEGANLVSAGNQGILNGTQVYAPIQIPVNVCGNGVGVLGAGIGVSGDCTSVAGSREGGNGGYHSMASSEGAEAAHVKKHGAKHMSKTADTTKPAKVAQPQHVAAPQHDSAGPNLVSAGNSGIGNGTQVYTPVQVPVNVAGNGVGVLGVGLGVNGASDAAALSQS